MSGPSDMGSMEPQQSHSYFVPMVDMLAGVVFILIVLLVSANLVSRDDFVTAQKAQSSAPAGKATPANDLPLDPRRQVELATRMLLDRLSRTLEARGYHVDSNVAEGRLTITEVDAFAASQPGLSPQGDVLVAALAGTLSTELPCLSGAARTAQRCRGYPDVRLETAQVEVVPGSGSQADQVLADSRALSVMSATIGRQPGLLALRSPGGVGLFTYAAASPAPLAAINLRFQFAERGKGR